MKLIGYFQNRPLFPMTFKPSFTDAHLVQKAYYC